ncbi:MAG: DNA recombination/repair protein RecA, partial [Bacteroidales bacterium]|nr:DNA recombination/repair protein RecA [Candidatus Equimonas enterica]
PFQKAEFELSFGEGISVVGEVADLGVEYDVIRKSGSWFSYGEARLCQGREALKRLLRDNDELREEITANIYAAIEAAKTK